MRERFPTDEEFRHLGEILKEIETHGSTTPIPDRMGAA